jgi:hypothetical protein
MSAAKTILIIVIIIIILWILYNWSKPNPSFEGLTVLDTTSGFIILPDNWHEIDDYYYLYTFYPWLFNQDASGNVIFYNDYYTRNRPYFWRDYHRRWPYISRRPRVPPRWPRPGNRPWPRPRPDRPGPGNRPWPSPNRPGSGNRPWPSPNRPGPGNRPWSSPNRPGPQSPSSPRSPRSARN